MENLKKSTWEILSTINCNDKIEKKNGLNYLSWVWAWAIAKENFPDANYAVIRYNGIPYLFDEKLGYLIVTTVTIAGETIGMQLPVMDGANKAQKHLPYTYKIKEYINGKWTGKYIDKTVEPATMFDINTAIMRCLTKNLTMFGLGHYIYAGEDLPPVDIINGNEENKTPKKEVYIPIPENAEPEKLELKDGKDKGDMEWLTEGQKNKALARIKDGEMGVLPKLLVNFKIRKSFWAELDEAQKFQDKLEKK